MLNILKIGFFCFALAGFSAAQLDPMQIPQACQSPCQNLLDLANTCVAEYPSTDSKPTSTACFCNGLPALDYSTCTSCLEANAPALAQSVSQLSDFCTQFTNGCSYPCSFETCPSSDVQCQCNDTYLQNIYNCAFCNSGHGNTGVTTISDYTTLSDSCSNQGQTDTPTGVDPAPTPSGTIPYTGGGISLASALGTRTSSTPATGATGTRSSSVTTGRTGGVNTGAMTTTSLGANPSNIMGGSGKTKISIFGGISISSIVVISFLTLV